MTIRTVGIIETFDVENHGDLLFPLLAEHELSRRLGEVTLRRYSYHRRDAATWPYEVRSTTDLLADLDELDGRVIGGGHLVRFDRDVAPGYRPAVADLHHPTSIWLTPVLAAAAAGVPVAWNAVGASAGTPAWAHPWLRTALAASAYVSVRDADSAAELRSVAPGTDVLVTPDSAFGLVGALPALVADDEVDALLARLGIDGLFVVLQASAALRAAAAQLRAALPQLRDLTRSGPRGAGSSVDRRGSGEVFGALGAGLEEGRAPGVRPRDRGPAAAVDQDADQVAGGRDPLPAPDAEPVGDRGAPDGGDGQLDIDELVEVQGRGELRGRPDPRRAAERVLADAQAVVQHRLGGLDQPPDGGVVVVARRVGVDPVDPPLHQDRRRTAHANR